MGRNFGIVAMIFGSISIPLCGSFAALGSLSSFYSIFLGGSDILIGFSVIGWVIPAIAIIFGIIGIIKDDVKGLSIAGLILGSLAIILGLMLRFMIATLLSGIVL
jgi:hypothetical protein